MCGNASFDSWNHIQGPIQLYIWGYWCHFLLNPPCFEAEVGWLFILHASLGLSRYLHQLCAFDLRVKQLAGPWLTVFINRPLVSLMNCSVPERLLMPFLWVPAVHVGGLFHGTECWRVLQSVTCPHESLLSRFRCGFITMMENWEPRSSQTFCCVRLYCARSQDFHVWSELWSESKNSDCWRIRMTSAKRWTIFGLHLCCVSDRIIQELPERFQQIWRSDRSGPRNSLLKVLWCAQREWNPYLV